MSKTSNLQKLAVLKVWLAENIKKRVVIRPKKFDDEF